MGTLDIINIVEERLKKDGYDGLFSDDGECACVIGELAPCGNIQADCSAGYRVDTPDEDHDFLIQAKKPPPKPSVMDQLMAVQPLPRQQRWLFNICMMVGVHTENPSEVVLKVADMVEDLGADLSVEDIVAVLREVLINQCCWPELDFQDELDRITAENGWELK